VSLTPRQQLLISNPNSDGVHLHDDNARYPEVCDFARLNDLIQTVPRPRNGRGAQSGTSWRVALPGPDTPLLVSTELAEPFLKTCRGGTLHARSLRVNITFYGRYLTSLETL
jgi:hypothetical protein